jgi:hypoxanthine phosphoribosyltransferase
MDSLDSLSDKLADPIERVLFTREEILLKVEELGRKITADYQGKDLIVVCVLKGALYFTADLIRQIKIPITLDFIAVSSYGPSTRTSGIARITKDLDEDIEGRHVMLVEDILDTGLTLDYLMRVLKLRNPEDLKICTLLDKPSHRIKKEVIPDYLGFEIPELFVVGYGLDYNHKFRHLPFICTFKKEYIPEK